MKQILAKLNRVIKALDNNVEKLTSPYEKCRLECDGLTRVLHRVLTENHIAHTVYSGQVTWNGKVFPVHFWIQLPDGAVVDYRLRMWFGNNAPNGIFKPEQNDVKYKGRPSSMDVCNDMIFNILVNN